MVDILFSGPFLQTKRSRRKGCQIDLLIQTRFQTLYLCEIKFSQRPIDIDVIESMQTKIKHLEIPKGFSYRPILIHVNGVKELVEDSGFFAQIIDFEQLL